MQDDDIWYRFPCHIFTFTPYILTACVIYFATKSPQVLIAIPFVWLGSVCAVPSLNLANGCLAYSTMVLVWPLVGLWQPQMACIIMFGTFAGLYITAGEQHLRLRPIDKEMMERESKHLEQADKDRS